MNRRTVRRTKERRTRRGSSALADVLRLIPGYDPFGTAGACAFDEAAGLRAVDFFRECLTHIEGTKAKQPFILEPWQQAIVLNLFGWKRPDGTRRYRECFLEVPRKNGKTPLGSGILNYMLFADGEPGAQCYGAAGDREQASLLFRHAAGMVRNDNELSKRAVVYDSYKSIVLRDDPNSAYKVLSAEGDTKHGGNPHFVVIDELHVQPDRNLHDTLISSFASENRRQPLFMTITTAGHDRHSICREKYDYAANVRDGVIEDQAFLPVIYEAAADDNWTDEAIWAKANPNLGVSVSREYMRRECARAQQTTAYENTFRRLHLNQWTEQDTRWVSVDKWNALQRPMDFSDFAGKSCWAGLDLSSTRDLTAFVTVFREAGTYSVFPFFWCPAESIRERSLRDRVPYDEWSRQGFIEATPGNVVDYDRVRERIRQIGKQVRIREIAVDRWNSTQIQTQLMGDGFTVSQFGQGFASMTAPTKELDKLIAGGQVAHDGNPVLRWMASNVTVEQDAAGNLKPSKARSGEKIDGIVAAIMAIGRAMTTDHRPSVYESRGLLVL